MRNTYLYGLILTFCMTASSLIGQVHFDISNVTVESESTVDIEFKVNNYKNISNLQLSINFDPSVITYNSVQSIDETSGLTAGDFLLQSQDGSSDPNAVTVLYYSGMGTETTLPDGTTIFVLRFNVVGAPGSSSTITFSDNPIEFYAASNDAEFEVTFTPGSVTKSGSDPNALTVLAPEVEVMAGASFCLPITARKFNNVQSGGGNFVFDTSVVKYKSVSGFHPAFATSGFGAGNFSNVVADTVSFVYFNNTPATMVSVPDNEKLFDLCFDAVGQPGTSTVIDLASTESIDFQWQTDNNVVLPSQTVDGKVTIVAAPSEDITFEVENKTIVKGKTECVKVLTKHFDNMKVTQFGFQFDTTHLKFVEAKETGLSNTSVANPPNSDKINFLWGNATESVSLPDGASIFELCFEAKGDCNSSSVIKIGDVGDLNEVLVDNQDGAVTPVIFKEGTINIVCEPQCEVVRIDKACQGQETGNVIVAIENGCDCVWTDADNNQVATGSGTNCNLTGVAAGSYKLVVTCPDGQPGCSRDVIVEEHPGVSLEGTISYDGCTGLGAIKLTTSVTEGLEFKWTPEVNNNTNPTGLSPGTYKVDVTNTATQCVESKEFVIGNEDVSLKFSSIVVVDVKCKDDNTGSVNVTTTGGCGELTYVWEPSVSTTSSATNLSGGTYKVTITDSSNPAVAIDTTIQVKSSSAIEINPVTVGSDGANGSITLNTTGGTEPYTYDWTGADNLPNSDMISGLAPGEYRVTITDASGCTITSDVIIVPDNNGSGVAATAGTLTHVLCHGDETGVIGGVLTSGKTPIKVVLSGAASKEAAFTALGSYKIEGLSAGSYTVTISDADAKSTTFTDIVIEQPEKLAINYNNSDITCDKEGSCNGEAKISVSGGVEPYSYEWSQGRANGASVDSLCKGEIFVVVTDHNGCRVMETFNIKDCSESDHCYVADKVITPNGDGRNDVFSISCVQDNSATLTVYDRWGRQVYQKSNYDNTWNGEDTNGVSLQESSYMWVLQITFSSGKTQIEKGTVTLLR